MSDRTTRMIAKVNARYAKPATTEELIDQVNGTDAPKLAQQVHDLVTSIGAGALAGLGSESLRSILALLYEAPEASEVEEPAAVAQVARRAPTRSQHVHTTAEDLYAYLRQTSAPPRAQTIARDPVTGKLIIR